MAKTGISIEAAKAELQSAISGSSGRYWNYSPAVSAVLAALEQAEQRIAELEVRTLTVKLPQGYVVRAGHPINEGERGVMIPKEGGDWLHRFDVEHALRVAGISVPPAETISNPADFAIDEASQVTAALNQTHVKQAASNSPVRPDGWVMVPVNATRAMIDAAARVEEDGYDAMHKAMLAAAPKQGAE